MMDKISNKQIIRRLKGSQALVILALKELGGIATINQVSRACSISRATAKSALMFLEDFLILKTRAFETYALSNQGRIFLGLPENNTIEKMEDQINPGFVYFVHNGENIKIGYSVDPYQRMGDLQSGTDQPLKLLAVIPGSKKDEKKFHAQFSESIVIGEWFKPTEALNKIIEENSLDAEKNFFSRNNSNKESLILNKDNINTNTSKKILSHEFLKAQGVWANQIEQIASLVNYDLALLESQFNGDDLPLILWRIKTGVPPPEPKPPEEEGWKKYVEGEYSDFIEH